MVSFKTEISSCASEFHEWEEERKGEGKEGKRIFSCNVFLPIVLLHHPTCLCIYACEYRFAIEWDEISIVEMNWK